MDSAVLYSNNNVSSTTLFEDEDKEYMPLFTTAILSNIFILIVLISLVISFCCFTSIKLVTCLQKCIGSQPRSTEHRIIFTRGRLNNQNNDQPPKYEDVVKMYDSAYLPSYKDAVST